MVFVNPLEDSRSILSNVELGVAVRDLVIVVAKAALAVAPPKKMVRSDHEKILNFDFSHLDTE